MNPSTRSDSAPALSGRPSPPSLRPEAEGAGPVRVWDPAVRLFHWSLAGLVAVNLYTGLVGGLREMDVHMISGYVILALVLFRLGWGVAGSRAARFATFVRGPITVASYVRTLFFRSTAPSLGHNPLGGWSVVALLASLLVQGVSGLFTSDDIFVDGPLVERVPAVVSDWMTWVHDLNSTVLMVLIGIHLAAIAFYRIVKQQDLIGPMITGRKTVAAGVDADPAAASGLRALLILAAAALIVWLIVTGS